MSSHNDLIYIVKPRPNIYDYFYELLPAFSWKYTIRRCRLYGLAWVCHPRIITPSDVLSCRSIDAKFRYLGCRYPLGLSDDDFSRPGTTTIMNRCTWHVEQGILFEIYQSHEYEKQHTNNNKAFGARHVQYQREYPYSNSKGK